MRRPDDLPVALPGEWRRVVEQLARVRQMEPEAMPINLRREQLRKQTARIQPAARLENSMTEAETHVTLLITRALHRAQAEEFVEALDFLQKATDQITQINARKQQTRMTGGGRPYRKAADDEAVAV
jgi:predicted RecB family endonuclease